jgi:hypothetical protein
VRFVDAVCRSAQDPFGASMQFLEALGYLYEGDAYIFSVFAHGDEDRHPDFRQALFRDEPYSTDERAKYETLSDDNKEAVLGFETVLLHELTHQIDTLTTPMAALLHTMQVEEFGRLVPVFRSLAARPALDISDPLARSAVLPDHPVRAALRNDGHLEAVEELLAYTAQLRPFDGIAASDVTPGWGEDRGYIALFGEPFEAVTLFGETRTIRRSDSHRPVTLQSVLETHSLANCLSHILWRFRDDPATGAREMTRYLHRFYPAGADDYRFVFDAMAKFLGFADFPAALDQLAKTGVTSLDQIPVLAGLLGWAALHSAQPTERLVYSADYLRVSIKDGVHFDSPPDLLRHIDQQAGLLPTADEALELARQLVREQRSRVPPRPEGLAGHFIFVLETVERELTTRIDRGHGLGDPVGTPNLGNPARYLTAEQVDEFGGMYRPDPAYDSWRQLRTLMLARRKPSADKHDALAAWLAKAKPDKIP